MKLATAFATLAMCKFLIFASSVSGISVSKREIVQSCVYMHHPSHYTWHSVDPSPSALLHWNRNGMIPIDIIQDVKDQSVTFHVKVDIAKGSQSNGGGDIGHMMLDNYLSNPNPGSLQKFSQFRYELVDGETKKPIGNWWLNSGSECTTNLPIPKNYQGSFYANVYEKM